MSDRIIPDWKPPTDAQRDMQAAADLAAEAIELALSNPEAAQVRLDEATRLAARAELPGRNGEPAPTLDEISASVIEALRPTQAEREEALDADQFLIDVRSQARIRAVAPWQRDFDRPPTPAERRLFAREGFDVSRVCVAVVADPDPKGCGERLWLRKPRWQQRYDRPRADTYAIKRRVPDVHPRLLESALVWWPDYAEETAQ